MATWRKAFAVTPGDATAIHFTALYVGGGGNVTVRLMPNVPGAPGATVTYTAVPAGQMLFIEGDRVMSTGTTATAIVAQDL